VPPAWVEARLRERGFQTVRIASDDRLQPRGLADLKGLATEKAARPAGVDEGLWFALDRYRRDRLQAVAAAGGLLQWSGWYRISARRGGS
jgi:hypothetical protein